MLENTLRNLGKLPHQLGKIGDVLTKEIKRNVSGRYLNRRSGDLYRSWEWAVAAVGLGWKLTVGSDVAYARIHEFGGFTGKNHATKIRATRYVSRAVFAKKAAIRSIMERYVARLHLR